jgi:hypothetical protein
VPLPLITAPTVQLPLPFNLTDSVIVESIEGWLQPSDFMLWKDMISKEIIEQLAGTEVALIHRFGSSGLVGLPEQESRDLLHRIFVGLRLVKPTSSPFRIIQLKKQQSGRFEVFSFSAPDISYLNLPESEILNEITIEDLVHLRSLVSPLFKVFDNGPENICRAIRYYEGGYSDIQDSAIQLVVWMMGIESLFVSPSDIYSEENIFAGILKTVGTETDIYSEFRDRDLYGATKMTIGSVLPDLFKLRNDFVHGAGVRQEWLEQRSRMAISGGSLSHADALREAASFILRTSIRTILRIP